MKTMKNLFDEKEFSELTQEEIAQYEDAYTHLDAWLKKLCLTKKERKANRINERSLLDLIIENIVEITEDFKLKYNLVFPIKVDGGNDITSITYEKHRLLTSEVERSLKDVDMSDSIKVSMAYTNMVTNIAPAILKKTDYKDYKNFMNATVYFL